MRKAKHNDLLDGNRSALVGLEGVVHKRGG